MIIVNEIKKKGTLLTIVTWRYSLKEEKEELGRDGRERFFIYT